MAYVMKPGQGSLFKNKEKESETHADYTGQANIEDRGYWINAWIKTSKTGEKYMSLSIKPKQARAAAPAPDLDDPVPF